MFDLFHRDAVYAVYRDVYTNRSPIDTRIFMSHYRRCLHDIVGMFSTDEKAEKDARKAYNNWLIHVRTCPELYEIIEVDDVYKAVEYRVLTKDKSEKVRVTFNVIGMKVE